jgi:hypothetical protein
VAELKGELALEDDERLVEVVAMQPRPSSSRELDDGEVAAAVFASEQHSGHVISHGGLLSGVEFLPL